MLDFSSSGSPFSLIVIGASAGGIEALKFILGSLPADLPSPIAIVQHCGDSSPRTLPHVLGRNSSLFIKHAEEGEHLFGGHVYIAPPGLHLLIGIRGTAALSEAPKVCYSRPSVDLLFKSAAMRFPKRTLGLILTGGNNDGAEGVQSIRNFGGMTIAQDRASSLHFTMPGAAIATGCVDFVLPLNRIATAVIALAMMRGAAEWMRPGATVMGESHTTTSLATPDRKNLGNPQGSTIFRSYVD